MLFLYLVSFFSLVLCLGTVIMGYHLAWDQIFWNLQDID